jgi:hypothetical protein
VLGAYLYPRTAAEIAAGVIVTDYSIPSHENISVILPERYGLAANGSSGSAAANSTAIQNASDIAYSLGGGTIQFPGNTTGTYIAIDTPPKIWETVSIRGASQRNSTFLKKTTATASTVSDATVRAWDSAVVGAPVCVLHFVGHNGTDSWSYGTCENITCPG